MPVRKRRRFLARRSEDKRPLFVRRRSFGLPASVSLVSGINAIAHAVEALYAENANPVASSLAELATALPRIVANMADQQARADALFGAWVCGTCLGAVGMALHHKL